MPRFEHKLPPPDTPEFKPQLLSALALIPTAQLGLEQALRQGNAVSDNPVQWMILSCTAEGDQIEWTLGIFFNSLIAGCACSGDPSSENLLQEYTEARLKLGADNQQFQLEFI